MKAIVHVTDLVLGAPVDESAITGLDPILGGFLRVPVPADAKPGDVTFIVVKATVQTVVPG